MSDLKIVDLSEAAAAKVKEYLSQTGKTGSAIRISLIRTHCMGGRGFGYVVDEDSPKEGDVIVEDKGVKMLIEPAVSQLLKGTQIDYINSLQGNGLTINNPNAVGKCPCGHHDIFSEPPE
ncbi:MAG: iron-sulfur cluster assembly accessory protein [Thaumarchaeota archaeon]|nr:iron-sulfur cluster assembly accessory protein [Nitrososphaerota archaeon]